MDTQDDTTHADRMELIADGDPRRKHAGGEAHAAYHGSLYTLQTSYRHRESKFNRDLSRRLPAPDSRPLFHVSVQQLRANGRYPLYAVTLDGADPTRVVDVDSHSLRGTRVKTGAAREFARALAAVAPELPAVRRELDRVAAGRYCDACGAPGHARVCEACLPPDKALARKAAKGRFRAAEDAAHQALVAPLAALRVARIDAKAAFEAAQTRLVAAACAAGSHPLFPGEAFHPERHEALASLYVASDAFAAAVTAHVEAGVRLGIAEAALADFEATDVERHRALDAELAAIV